MTAEPPTADTQASTAGLRERKKQRTRAALLRTAVELFTTQGYEETTIDEIVDAVEVSQRTFFRYFASKEEVAFALQHMVEQHFVAALRERPADEGPFDALRNSVLAAWDTIGEAITQFVPIEDYLRLLQVIESTPALLAVHLRRSFEMEENVAGLIAEQGGRRRGPRPPAAGRGRRLQRGHARHRSVVGAPRGHLPGGDPDADRGLPRPPRPGTGLRVAHGSAGHRRGTQLTACAPPPSPDRPLLPLAARSFP